MNYAKKYPEAKDGDQQDFGMIKTKRYFRCTNLGCLTHTYWRDFLWDCPEIPVCSEECRLTLMEYDEECILCQTTTAESKS